MSLKVAKNAVYKLNSGYTIPVIGLGVYKAPADETAELVYKALRVGYRHIDSAQFYNNEAAVVDGIAKYLKDFPGVKRSEIFYTTKLNTQLLANEPAKSAQEGRDKLASLVADSLDIAKPIDYVDLFLVHSPFPDKATRLVAYGLLQDAVAQGKVKSIGVSNYGKHHIEELFAWDGYKIKPVINQIELNPWLTRKELVDYLRSQDILVEAYSPLTRGIRINDPELQVLAEKYGKSTGQILIRWSVDQGFVTLPKTVTESRLVQNLESVDFELSKEDLESLTHHDQYWVSNPSWDPVTYQDK